MKCRFNLVVSLALLAAGAPVFAAESPKVDGWKVTYGGQTFTIDPPSVKSGSVDATMKAGVPYYGGPVLLPGPAWTYAALRVDSLVVTLAADKSRLEINKDYVLDPKWASIGPVEGGKAPPGTKIHAEYKYGMSRIDLVEQSADGKIHLVKGAEDKGEPLLPKTKSGDKALFSIYMPNSAEKLSPDDINMIDPSYDGIPPVMRAETLQPVKELLASGKPVTIAFLGDSITEQPPRDFRDHKGSYVVRFSEYLGEKYPASKVVVIERGKPVPEPEEHQILIVKAGKGGDDTPRALARLNADVLAHKPNLVVVMLGVNDENRKGDTNSVPVPQYKKNMLEIVDKIRAAGAEPLLMTTSMKNLGWAGCVGNLDQYAQAVRDIGADKKICVVDNFAAWQQLPKRGYNYMVFLDNSINHPIDLGHDLFLRGLKAAFEK